MSRVVTYVEIDVPMCSLTYGVNPCAAGGGPKCFNSLGTCQARPSFTLQPTVLRLTDVREHADPDIDALPCLERAETQTNKISLGEDLGIRSSVSIQCSDFRHSDTGPVGDRYWDERDWDAYDRGTFWSRFRMRHPYMRGRSMRVYRGELGRPLSELAVRHYTVNNVLGPDARGQVTITGQDVLKFADGDRAQAPRPSEGFLMVDLEPNTTTVQLMPTGIGNLDYPTSGLVAIGGEEVCEFTRSGDTMTLVRGARDTERTQHKAGDRVQLCLEYSGQSPADIIRDLLVNYAEVPPALIPLPEWQLEVNTHLRRLYTRTIAEPTSVRRLISDLIKQAALAVWHDDVSNRIRLQVLKPTPADAGVLSEDVYSEGSAAVSDQPDRRISTCQVLYGLKHPLLDTESPESYRSMALTADVQGQVDYGSPAIEVVYGSWIPAYARQVASRLGALRVGRYALAPRRVTMEVHKTAPIVPSLGGGYFFTAWSIQDATGMATRIPVQVVSVQDMDDRVRIEAEEATFLPIDEEDLTNRVITLDGNAFNVNLRQIHDSIYPAPTTEDTITFIIPPGVIIGSRVHGQPAMDTGVWPAGVVPELQNLGRIQGRGGNGGAGGMVRASSFIAGQSGSTALRARSPVRVTANNQIWGGGGGGGGIFVALWDGLVMMGGGGAGYQGGSVYTMTASGNAETRAPAVGTTEAGGLGARIRQTGNPSFTSVGGNGGAPGQPGGVGTVGFPNYPGEAGGAGHAIQGLSYLTFTSGMGDVRGPTT